MAEEKRNQSIFNIYSPDRVESPEKTDEYIRIGNPGIFITIAAMFIAVVAMVIWGFTGTLPVTETVLGVVDLSNDNHITCFVDASDFFAEGLMGKSITGHLSDKTTVKGKIELVGTVPVSMEEASKMIDNDWLTSNLVTSNYSYIISIEPEKDLADYAYELVEVSIITEEVKPITFLLR